MNSQVLIDRVFLQDLLFLIKQPRTKIDARAVLVFGIERAIDRINSEALSGYAVRDSRIAELEQDLAYFPSTVRSLAETVTEREAEINQLRAAAAIGSAV